MTAGDLLVRVTAWLAFAAYLGGTVAGLRHSTGRAFRLLWLAGAVLLFVHLLSAFHFKHGWSHVAAYEDTARQTREVTGLNWGGGIHLNYLLVIVWLADATGQLLSRAAQPFRLRQALAGFYAFMWFNAAVIFVRDPMRWVGAAAFVFLAVFAWRQWRSATGAPASDPVR